MTIHSVKGLEFDNVFVTGMEEEISQFFQNAYVMGNCGIYIFRRIICSDFFIQNEIVRTM